jgi:molybdopterin synthase sulfur carrier subunit
VVSAVVRVPAALVQDAGGRRTFDISLADGSTLADLLDEVARQYPALERRVRDETGSLRRFVNVYIGADESRSLDGVRTRIEDGQEIFVVGSVAGG